MLLTEKNKNKNIMKDLVQKRKYLGRKQGLTFMGSFLPLEQRLVSCIENPESSQLLKGNGPLCSPMGAEVSL